MVVLDLTLFQLSFDHLSLSTSKLAECFLLLLHYLVVLFPVHLGLTAWLGVATNTWQLHVDLALGTETDSLLLLLICASIADVPIGGEDVGLMADVALVWLVGQWLVLSVVKAPVDHVHTSFAEVVEWYIRKVGC